VSDKIIAHKNFKIALPQAGEKRSKSAGFSTQNAPQNEVLCTSGNCLIGQATEKGAIT